MIIDYCIKKIISQQILVDLNLFDFFIALIIIISHANDLNYLFSHKNVTCFLPPKKREIFTRGTLHIRTRIHRSADTAAIKKRRWPCS